MSQYTQLKEELQKDKIIAKYMQRHKKCIANLEEKMNNKLTLTHLCNEKFLVLMKIEPAVTSILGSTKNRLLIRFLFELTL